MTGFSFLIFNLLCAPCFAAIGAIKREMNNAKWTWFAIGYQFGGLFTGNVNPVGLVFAILILALMIYMLFIKKYEESTTLTEKLRTQGS